MVYIMWGPLWLASLTQLMFSRLIHVVACVCTSFLLITKYNSIVWIYYILFIHSSVDGYLDFFCFLVIMKNCVQVSEWTFVFSFLGYICLGMELMRHSDHSGLNHLGNCQTDFQSGCIILHSHQQCVRVLISPHPYQHLLTWLFDSSHPSGSEMIPHCGFVFHFFDD